MLAWVITSFLVASEALDTLAKCLNLRSARGGVPAEFAAWYDPARYRRSQEYTRASTIFHLAADWTALGALLLFWALGGFGRVDDWVRAAGWGPVATGLAYFAVLAVGQEVVGLPFSVYQTFGLEARFGFNRTTLSTFVSDRLKGWALGAGLGGALGAVVLGVFERFGPGAWCWVWAIVAAATLALLYVSPRWLLPLFFKMSPLAEGELREALLALCRRQAFPVRDLFVIDGSRRSAKANAFFIGFGPNKRIALFDTLVKGHSLKELLAVLAHEIGHARKGHVWKGMIASQASLFLFFLAVSLCVTQPAVLHAFGITRPSYHAGLAAFSVCVRPLGFWWGVLLNRFSRKNEYEADRFAAEAIGDAEPLIVALKTLSKDNLANLTPHPLLVSLEFSHPPVLQRIAALRRLASSST